MKTILIINGPNLDKLGQREPEVYGNKSYADLCEFCQATAAQLGCQINIRQSNYEGQIIEWLHNCSDFSGIIINAAGYTHTSVAIYDALRLVDIPVIEVHLSNIMAREPFRRHSILASAVKGSIAGFGFNSYKLAMMQLSFNAE